MPPNWEKIKNAVKVELSDTAATTKKYFKIGKGKLDIMNINNSLNDTFRKLGVEVDNLISKGTKEDIRQNPKVISLIEKIKKLKQEIKKDKLKIEVIKKGSVPLTKTEKDTNNSSDVKAKKRA